MIGEPTKPTGMKDFGQLQECQEEDKFLNFAEEYLDYFEYEQGINPNIVVAGRLNSYVQFWHSIGASQIISDVIDYLLMLAIERQAKRKQVHI